MYIHIVVALNVIGISEVKRCLSEVVLYRATIIASYSYLITIQQRYKKDIHPPNSIFFSPNHYMSSCASLRSA
nr:MAG TPA: hypothetical protein [Caudoviricetes sp.]